MTSDTFASKFYGDIYCGPAGREIKGEAVKINEAGVYPGYCIRFASGLIVLAKNSDKSFGGIAAANPGQDLDTAYDIYDKIEYFPARAGNQLVIYYLAASPAVNLMKGDILVLSATDGMTMKFAYANATDITDDSEINYVGRALEAITGSTSDNKLVKAIV